MVSKQFETELKARFPNYGFRFFDESSVCGEIGRECCNVTTTCNPAVVSSNLTEYFVKHGFYFHAAQVYTDGTLWVSFRTTVF